MSAKTDNELDAIIAYGVGMSLSLQEKHKDMTALVLDALDFDMADHFPVTGDSYLGRVPKGLIVEALDNVGAADDRDALMAMQKKALVPIAEQRLSGKCWVPEIIRTPIRKLAVVKSEAKPSAGKAVAAKKAVKAGKPTKPEAKTKAKAKGVKAKTVKG